MVRHKVGIRHRSEQPGGGQPGAPGAQLLRLAGAVGGTIQELAGKFLAGQLAFLDQLAQDILSADEKQVVQLLAELSRWRIAIPEVAVEDHDPRRLGRSFAYNRPAKDLIWERLAMTAIMAMATLVFTFVVVRGDLAEYPYARRPTGARAAWSQSALGRGRRSARISAASAQAT